MVAEELGRLKWFLRHGNVFRALQTAEDLEVDLDVEDPGPEQRKLQRAVAEFSGYIRANAECIPNYGEALPSRRGHLQRLRGVGGQPSGEQADGEEAADALDTPGGRISYSRSAPGCSRTNSPTTSIGGSPGSPTRPPIDKRRPRKAPPVSPGLLVSANIQFLIA